MSGPATVLDADPTMAACGSPSAPCIAVDDSRDEVVGRIRVRRALPRKGRRTVGAWCFADHMGPADVTENSGPDVGPHPHIGLQTVTWLIDGQVLHRDSLGSEQVITPGQLNLMTAGDGVSHAEEATGSYPGAHWRESNSGSRNPTPPGSVRPRSNTTPSYHAPISTARWPPCWSANTETSAAPPVTTRRW